MGARILIVLLLCSGGLATVLADSPLKRPLDLPSGGIAEDDCDEIDFIYIFRRYIEANSFVICMDISGSMNEEGFIDVLKGEVIQAIQSMSPRSELGLVAFNTTTEKWRDRPTRATPAHKAAAIAWVQSLEAEGWTCLEPAGVTAVQMSNLSMEGERRMIVIGDGLPLCQGIDTSEDCLVNITAANHQRTRIDTIFLGDDPLGLQFMQQLAALNSGIAGSPGD